MKKATLFLLCVFSVSCGKYPDQSDLESVRDQANNGNSRAQFKLALSYENDPQLDGNLAMAKTWYLKAAEQGDPDAQHRLGFMFEQGRGTAIDLAAAADWYLLAAEQGHLEAQYEIGRMYYTGTEVIPADPGKAANWFQSAAEHGHKRAQRLLGEMYFTGLGVPQSYFHSFVWLTIAKREGMAGSLLLDTSIKKLSREDLADAQKHVEKITTRIESQTSRAKS